ncbi:hypothetical protein FGRMN_6555 [Fusarium graminum]|nr:hypothetical protein FGRMN_6555 [Fusarium graminum]
MSLRYTAKELLHLRHASPDKEISYKLAAKVEEDYDLGEIIRTGSAKPLSLIVEESGSSSDSDDQFHQGPAQQLDGTDSERKYRGRSDSELDRVPMTAPADLNTQKSEGFQKFYNSVVSPTHVRVTAGGRIVPNTRGPHSPTSKWNRERSSFDGHAHARTLNGNQPESMPYPVLPPGWGQFATMLPPHLPGTIPGMALRPEGYPFMAPTPMGYNMGTIPYNQFPPPAMPMQHPSQTGHFNKHPDLAAEQARNIHLSPVDQFDPSRPFLYNGQWLIANGNNLYPYVPPHTGFAPPPIHNQPPPKYSGDLNGPSGRYGRVSSRQPEPLSMNMQITADDASYSTSPPVSSIRPSSITQKQLEVLRSQKRYHQDQLQYNKHQIDLRDMEDRLQNICREIKHFERMHATQLEFEARKYPKAESPDDEAPSSSSAGYPHSHSIPSSPIVAEQMPTSFGTQSNEAKNHSRSASVHTLPKPATMVVSAKNSSTQNNDTAPQRKPSSLPVNAALAPVFQPRSEMNNSAITADGIDKSTHAQPYRHMSNSAATWRPYFKKEVEAAKTFSTPYLIGKLKPGIHPEDAQDIDYTYDRQLTEDEERARYMYWGKAPRHVQGGLPRFDGRDFYPPSTATDGSFNAVESVSQSYPKQSESKSPSIKTHDADPFHAMAQPAMGSVRHYGDNATRSESLHRTEDSLRASSTSDFPRSEPYIAHPGAQYMEFRRVINEQSRISSDKFSTRVSDDSGEEDGNLIFKGRRKSNRASSSKYPSDIWSTMRKKGKTSANVIAGQVSPMTAQGVLPHYSGHATASLTPAITTNSRGYAVRLGDANDQLTANTVAGRREENRHPHDLLTQQLRSASFQDKRHHGFSSH